LAFSCLGSSLPGCFHFFAPEWDIAAYEAGWVERTVIVEFDSVEMAEAAYESDAYRKALAAMMGGVERDFRILVGV
jgi:uncharacterized protein (DUF1330 family)